MILKNEKQEKEGDKQGKNKKNNCAIKTRPSRAFRKRPPAHGTMAVTAVQRRSKKCDAKINEYEISSSDESEAFLRSFVWSNNVLHNYLKESQKMSTQDNADQGTIKLPSYLSNNFR